jgi:uncharacterized protein YndB with AHSA1/START domain
VPDILMQFEVAAEPATVFNALTTEQGLAGWWIAESLTSTGGWLDGSGVPT